MYDQFTSIFFCSSLIQFKKSESPTDTIKEKEKTQEDKNSILRDASGTRTARRRRRKRRKKRGRTGGGGEDVEKPSLTKPPSLLSLRVSSRSIIKEIQHHTRENNSRVPKISCQCQKRDVGAREASRCEAVAKCLISPCKDHQH